MFMSWFLLVYLILCKVSLCHKVDIINLNHGKRKSKWEIKITPISGDPVIIKQEETKVYFWAFHAKGEAWILKTKKLEDIIIKKGKQTITEDILVFQRVKKKENKILFKDVSVSEFIDAVNGGRIGVFDEKKNQDIKIPPKRAKTNPKSLISPAIHVESNKLIIQRNVPDAKKFEFEAEKTTIHFKNHGQSSWIPYTFKQKIQSPMFREGSFIGLATYYEFSPISQGKNKKLATKSLIKLIQNGDVADEAKQQIQPPLVEFHESQKSEVW